MATFITLRKFKWLFWWRWWRYDFNFIYELFFS